MENPATNTTAPSTPPYRWVGESKQRGTFGIISLCFSTMIICVWSTLHFNIPIKRYSAIRRFFLHVSWMIIALLAPEVLLFLAINERIKAGILLKKVLKFHPHLAKPSMFTRMYDSIRGRAESKDKTYELIPQAPHPYFGIVHAFYAGMGGIAFYGSFDDNTPKSLFEISTNPRFTVDVPSFDALIYIMRYFPHIITDIMEDYILDQAAASSLSKALLIVQVAWFCATCASRLFQDLPLSLLEVSTAAHAFCTLLTYVVWWSKPFNVPTPTILRDKAAREVYALLKCSEDEYYKALEIARIWAAGNASMSTGPHVSGKIVLAAGALQHLLPIPKRPPVSNFSNHDRMLLPGTIHNKLQNGDFSVLMTMGISPILYGLLHFLGWSDQFPTPLEQLLWRVSSLTVTFSGLAGVFALLSAESFKVKYKAVTFTINALGTVIFFAALLAHALASGFLIVESVRQLSFLDDAAYQLPSWSNYWPHFS